MPKGPTGKAKQTALRARVEKEMARLGIESFENLLRLMQSYVDSLGIDKTIHLTDLYHILSGTRHFYTQEREYSLCALSLSAVLDVEAPDLLGFIPPESSGSSGASRKLCERYRMVSIETLTEPLERAAKHEASARVRDVVSGLPPNRSDVIRLRWGLDGRGQKTLEEVARMLGTTRQAVEQKERKAMRWVRENYPHLEALCDLDL